MNFIQCLNCDYNKHPFKIEKRIYCKYQVPLELNVENPDPKDCAAAMFIDSLGLPPRASPNMEMTSLKTFIIKNCPLDKLMEEK